MPALDRCHREMIAELRSGGDRPDPQRVLFWIRRMVFETAIHRMDVELAVGAPSEALPADLAADGVDEMLVVFLAGETNRWAEDYRADLVDWRGAWSLLAAGGRGWRVSLRPDGVRVAPAAGSAPGDGAVATVRGEPEALLRWLYNRAGPDGVEIGGDRSRVEELRRLLDAVLSVG